MILSEKISLLRKKNGWSQEELAQQLGVSRQSVSKWEGSQSVPDLDKLLLMSQIFGVSVDYLVKDEKGSEDIEYTQSAPDTSFPSVSVEEANCFLSDRIAAAKQIAAGVSICILSPVTLLLLGGLSNLEHTPVTEAMAAGFGISVLLCMVACAVVLFIRSGMKLEKYKYITENEFSSEYGVTGIAKTRQEQYAPTYLKGICAGVAACILGVIPLLIAGCFEAPDLILISCLCLLLIFCAAAVPVLIIVGMTNESFHQLLQEGDFTPDGKRRSRRSSAISTAYWCIVTAIYLAVNYDNRHWDITWVVWPIAGVLFAALMGILGVLDKNRD
ncbi:MAG: helix-turn-helix transcriptional regulator [Eubacteriales bacterium]|nr:helix-turn-helix transcriptional regulator [Eubacteriales bacterium]